MPQGILIDTVGDGEPRLKPEPKGRFGSTADERAHLHEGPLLGVKRTKSAGKRALPLEGRLSGVERSDQRQGPNYGS